MANDAYPYWIVCAARRSYTDPMDPAKWIVLRVQAEHRYLAQAQAERELPAYAAVVSVAQEVLSYPQ